MIIPLSESQLSTYLDTGKVTVELPSNCWWRSDIEPKEHSKFPGYWIPYTKNSQLANGEPGQAEDDCGITAPVKVDDRVAIGEEWRMPCWDDDTGCCGVYYRDGEFRWYRPGYHDDMAREYLSRQWRSAEQMPPELARYHATVQTIAFERRDDRWAWVVGLEAENAN